MCIAILKPKKSPIITKATMQACWDSNNDGVGYCFVKNGVIVIKKFMTFKPFWKEYSADQQNEGNHSDLVIHFRWATHGTVNLENCHPFLIDKHSAFVHNGIITKAVVPKGVDRSDTRQFKIDILRHLPNRWFDNPAIVKMVEDYIGGSKLIVLHTDGVSKVLNPQLGVWDNGHWYSNTCYKTPRHKVSNYYGNSSAWKQHSWDECGICGDWSNNLVTGKKGKKLCEICAEKELLNSYGGADIASIITTDEEDAYNELEVVLEEFPGSTVVGTMTVLGVSEPIILSDLAVHCAIASGYKPEDVRVVFRDLEEMSIMSVCMSMADLYALDFAIEQDGVEYDMANQQILSELN